MSDQRIADLQALLTEATRASDRQQREIDRLKRRIRELTDALVGCSGFVDGKPIDCDALDCKHNGGKEWCDHCGPIVAALAGKSTGPTLEAVARAALEAVDFALESKIEEVDKDQGDDCGECAGLYSGALGDARAILRRIRDDPAAIAAVVAAARKD